MSKWYHPFGLILLAAMVGDLSGCAQTSSWIAKRTEKKAKEKDEDVAIAKKDKSKDKDKSAKDKLSKDKSSKEIAQAKSNDPKSGAKKKVDGKVLDAEHEKYAAAERQKKNARTKAATAKDDANLVAKTTPKKTKPVIDDGAADEELGLTPKKPVSTSKIAKNKSPVTNKSLSKGSLAIAASSGSDDDDPFGEGAIDSVASESSNSKSDSKVVQVKKDDDDFGTHVEEEMQPDAKPVKTASVAENFEDELESPFEAKGKAESFSDKSDDVFATTEEKPKTDKSKARAAETDWDDDLSEVSMKSTRSPSKKQSSQGMLASCPNADDELSEVLKSMDPNDVESLRNGLHRIGQLPKTCPAATPLLRKMLKHDDAFVRTHAALAMVRRGIVSDDVVVVVVTESLKAQDPALRSFGTQVLEEMGPQTKEVLASLAKSLKDPDGQIRIRAAELLMTYEEWSYPALQTLLLCLKDKDENVRWLTTYSIADLQPQSPEAVQALMKTVRDPVQKVSVGAIYALGEIGPIAKRSSGELRRLADSTNDEELKKQIAYSLQRMEKEAP